MKKQTHLFMTAMTLITMLGACGKNMHLAAPNDESQSLKDKSTMIVLKKSEIKTELVSKDGKLTASSTLGEISDEDLKGLKLPYINQDADKKLAAPVQIGKSALMTENKVAYVTAANVVAEATLHLPEDRSIVKKITSLKMTLKGVRVLGANDMKATGQALCLLLGKEVTSLKLCSGEQAELNRNPEFWDADKTKNLVSTKFSELTLDQKIEELKSGGTLRGAESLEIDLLEAFALDPEKTEDVISFVYDHSKKVDGDLLNMRALQIVLANNTYVDSGELSIEAELDAARVSNDFNKELIAVPAPTASPTPAN